MKHWRIFSTATQKGLAAIATSVVQSFPDGLNKNQIQYAPQHSPLVWLHKFDI